MPRISRSAAAASLRQDALSRKALSREVQRQVKKFGLTQSLAATIVGDAATQMNRLMNGYAHEFSADRLVKFLLRLGSDVVVTIKHSKKRGRRGRARIRVSR